MRLLIYSIRRSNSFCTYIICTYILYIWYTLKNVFSSLLYRHVKYIIIPFFSSMYISDFLPHLSALPATVMMEILLILLVFCSRPQSQAALYSPLSLEKVHLISCKIPRTKDVYPPNPLHLNFIIPYIFCNFARLFSQFTPGLSGRCFIFSLHSSIICALFSCKIIPITRPKIYFGQLYHTLNLFAGLIFPIPWAQTIEEMFSYCVALPIQAIISLQNPNRFYDETNALFLISHFFSLLLF
jgi:hypothetical protein